jgi:hypothetical protein
LACFDARSLKNFSLYPHFSENSLNSVLRLFLSIFLTNDSEKQHTDRVDKLQASNT